MTRAIWRAVAVSALGAVLGALSLVVMYAAGPGIALDLSRDAPPVVSGLYPPERDASGLTFAWSRDRIQLALAGLDRRAAWRFRTRLRGARPDPRALPEVVVLVDGERVHREATTNEFKTIDVPIPPRADSRQGVTITIAVSQTFVPGRGDTRTLGVVVDDISLRPERGIVIPPRRMLAAAALAAALFGAWLSLLGLLPATAVGATALISVGQAFPLSRGLGPYSAFADAVPALAIAITACSLVLVVALERATAAPLRHTARFVAAFSAAALYLKALVLLHPDMPIGDALFHVHRWEWVRAGRYFFTSITPSGHDFPYAIGLYVFALPLADLATDKAVAMTILRLLTTSADVIAGICVYVMIVRAWGDRLAGAIGTALYHLAPIDFNVLATGNLTNSFAQSLSVVALALVAAPRWKAGTRWQVPAAVLFTSAAFLSHMSTFAILGVLLPVAAALYWTGGGKPLRPHAANTLLVAIAATIIALLAYYGWFREVYVTLVAQLRSGSTQDASQIATATRAGRLGLLPLYVEAFLGWPLVLLSTVGGWTLWVTGTRDRLSLLVAAWVLTSVGYLVLGVLTPIDMRHYLAVFPALSLLGGRGAAFLWRARSDPTAPPSAGSPSRLPLRRMATIVLLGAAVVYGIEAWTRPLR